MHYSCLHWLEYLDTIQLIIERIISLFLFSGNIKGSKEHSDCSSWGLVFKSDQGNTYFREREETLRACSTSDSSSPEEYFLLNSKYLKDWFNPWSRKDCFGMVTGRIAQHFLLSMLVLNVEKKDFRLKQNKIKKHRNKAEAGRFWLSNLPTNWTYFK